MVKNPYTPDEPAIDNFCGRRETLQKFRLRLDPTKQAYKDARHWLVMGVGGVGKTSLAHRLRLECRNWTRVALVTVGDYADRADPLGLIEALAAQIPAPSKLGDRALQFFHLDPQSSAADRAKAVAGRVLRQMGPKVTLGPTGPSIAFEAKPSVEKVLGTTELRTVSAALLDLFNRLFRNCGGRKRPLVVIVDEIGRLQDLPGGMGFLAELTRLGTKARQEQLSSLFLILTVRPGRKGWLEHCAPVELFPSDVFRAHNLHFFTEAEAREAITQPALEHELRITLAPELVDAIVERVQGWPYVLQMVCSSVWAALDKAGLLRHNATVTVPADAVQEALEANLREWFKRFMSDTQRLVLKELALSSLPLKLEIVAERCRLPLSDAEAVVKELLNHPRRPVRFLEQERTYAITRDVLRKAILDECGPEERQLRSLQYLLDSAARAYEERGLTLDKRALEEIWLWRDRGLEIQESHAPCLALSALRAGSLMFRPLVEHLSADTVLLAAASALQDADTGTRVAAVEALKQIGGQEGIEALVGAMHDEGTKVRIAAGNALSYLGEPRDFDEMIEVPAGEFLYEEDKKPLTLESFRIGKYPVTNAQYKCFVDANPEHRVPYVDSDFARPYGWDHEERTYPQGRANHPVVLVSWEDAQAYCAWLREATGRAFRLPTQEEWEKAARGTDGRKWPWGDEFDSDKANSREGGIDATTPVGCYPDGASPYGCLDMGGNVWDWTGSAIGETGKVVRGGSWYDYRDLARCAFRPGFLPVYRSSAVGFRVAE